MVFIKKVTGYPNILFFFVESFIIIKGFYRIGPKQLLLYEFDLNLFRSFYLCRFGKYCKRYLN